MPDVFLPDGFDKTYYSTLSKPSKVIYLRAVADTLGYVQRLMDKPVEMINVAVEFAAIGGEGEAAT